MKSNRKLLLLILFNMIAGNLIVAMTIASGEALAGKLVFHIVFSLAAYFLLKKLDSFFQRKIHFLTITALTVFSSFLVPVLSIYFIFAGFGLYEHEFKSLLIGIPVSLITGAVSYPLWLPLGLINSFYFIFLNRSYLRKENQNISNKN